MPSINIKTLAWSWTVEPEVVRTLTRPPGPRPEQFVSGPCSAPSRAEDPHSAPGFSINKIGFLRLMDSQPPAPRFQGLGMPTWKETRTAPTQVGKSSNQQLWKLERDWEVTGKWRESPGTAEPHFGCYFPFRCEASPGRSGQDLAISTASICNWRRCPRTFRLSAELFPVRSHSLQPIVFLFATHSDWLF